MSPSPPILFYPFVEGAVLHKEGSHRLSVLNHSSAVLWCLYEEHGLGDQLVVAYAEHFDLPLEQARLDVDNALAGFKRNNLISERPLPISAEPPTDLKPFAKCSQFPVKKSIKYWHKTYQMAGVSWQISSTDFDVEQWFDSLTHLETSLPHTDLRYELGESSSRWTLTGQSETVTGLSIDEVLPWLLTMLFADLCHRQPQSLLLHSAVLCRDNRLLLLPGESAFGKSTLAAALGKQGWTLYSDELAPLNTETLKVTPFPLPLGVKSRSLAALQPYYHDLTAQTAWSRADGQVVRYLSPPQIPLSAPDAPPAPVATLIFPRYLADAPTCLQRLTPLQALECLGQTGSSERSLRSSDVEALLALAGQRPCWSLEYSSLEEAISEVSAAWGLC